MLELWFQHSGVGCRAEVQPLSVLDERVVNPRFGGCGVPVPDLASSLALAMREGVRKTGGATGRHDIMADESGGDEPSTDENRYALCSNLLVINLWHGTSSGGE